MYFKTSTLTYFTLFYSPSYYFKHQRSSSVLLLSLRPEDKQRLWSSERGLIPSRDAAAQQIAVVTQVTQRWNLGSEEMLTDPSV